MSRNKVYTLDELLKMRIPIGTAEDLTGRQIGDLTVLFRTKNPTQEKTNKVYWGCKCSCGVYVIKRMDRLKNGTAKTCKTIYHEDLTGQVFGDLTVIKKTDKRTEHQGWIYECVCSCGNPNHVFVSAANLKNGTTRSCGHLRGNKPTDITGKVFGELTALYPTGEKRDGKQMWHCICSCGNYVDVRIDSLTSGNTTSCGHILSIGEMNISKILRDNNIPFISQKTFDDCRFPDTGYPARFDFYILTERPFILGFDGLQHDYYTGHGWNTKENFEKTIEHDHIKNNYCFSHNIPIKRIPYSKRDTITLDDILGDEFLLQPEQYWKDEILVTAYNYTSIEELEDLDIYYQA